jgi:hypothetical protein
MDIGATDNSGSSPQIRLSTEGRLLPLRFPLDVKDGSPLCDRRHGGKLTADANSLLVGHGMHRDNLEK